MSTVLRRRRDRSLRMRVVLQFLRGDEGVDYEPSRIDANGNRRRRGGFHPKARQNPGAAGMHAWRHDWATSKLSQLLGRTDTYEETSYGGKLFRSRLGVPRVEFDALVAEAKGYDELPDHFAGDGQRKKGPSCIPMRIKVGAVLNWMRLGGSLKSAADFADINENTVRRFAKLWATAVVAHALMPRRVAPRTNLFQRLVCPGQR